MEMSEMKQEAFLLLKGICNSIIVKPSAVHARQLNCVLGLIDKEIIEEFSEYILYPIKLHIFNNDSTKRNDLNCILLDILYQLLLHLKVKSEVQLLDIYSIICFSIIQENNPKANSRIKEKSEELKLIELKSVALLFTKIDEELLYSVYKKNEFYSKLSIFIYTSLQIASNEKNIRLRVAALECLLVLCGLNKVTFSTSDLNVDAAKFVKKCLPGIIIECRNIASQGPTQNHQITSLALKLWSRSVSLVLADCHHCKDDNPIRDLAGTFSAKNNLDEISNNRNAVSKDAIKSEEFNLDWVKAAAKALANMTEVFTDHKLNPHHKVRLELVSSATLILSHAPVNMNSSLSDLLDALIVLMEDEDKSVAQASKSTLEMFKNNWCKNAGRSLVEDVKNCLHSLINRLPRILHSTDDKVKESGLILLCGYIQLLGHDHFAEYISSQQLLDKLIVCLLEAATLDTSLVSLLEETTVRDIEVDSHYNTVSWRNLTVCHSDKLLSRLQKLFNTLANLPNLMDFAFCLIDQFNYTSLKRLELAFIINHVVLASQQIAQEQYSNIVKSILNEYLEPYFWESKQSSNVSELRKSTVQACLSVEGIGILAKSMGPEKFSPFLFKCLYPLLEYAGCPFWCLAEAGIQSVRSIANVYGADVGSLVKNNVDYLSHHITIKLKNVDENLTVLYVLSVIMKNSNMNTLPSIIEIIINVLIQSCDKFQSNNLSSYLHVFETFVTCLHSWLDDDDQNEIAEKSVEKELMEMLIEYQQSKLTSDSFDIGDSCSDPQDLDGKEDEKCDPGSDELADDNKQEVPDYIKLTEAIMNRSAHFLPSKTTSQQILVMKIMEKGSLILMNYQDILLPVVHKIWSPLVERFNADNDPLIIRNAFKLLHVLAFTSKDFIRQRSLRQVLPKLRKTLVKLSAESKLKSDVHSYCYSQKYKLQVDILQGLGDIAINIDLAGQDIYVLLETCERYLSSKQPQTLQDACIDLFIKLAKLNKEMVWLQVMTIFPQSNLLVLKTNFVRHYELQVRPENNEFCKNVQKLLKILFP